MLQVVLLLSLFSLPKEEVCELQGKVKIKESFATYKVYVTDNNPDLHVKWVVAFPNKPGKWQSVSSNEDFSIQFVDNKSLADFTIKLSSIYPGC